MSDVDPTVSNADVIPDFQSDIFYEQPEARFATGVVAYGHQSLPGRESAFDAYLRLRANVYVNQTRMLPPDSVINGREIDQDDDRSAHLAIIENAGRIQRVVGCMRIIHGGPFGVLPIQSYFPEANLSTNSRSNSVEISRYILRHERASIQDKLKANLFPVAVAYLSQKKLGPTFAVVEPPVEANLVAAGVPLERIAPPKYVPEYRGYNVGVLINIAQMAKGFEARSPGMITAKNVNELTFSGSLTPVNTPRAA